MHPGVGLFGTCNFKHVTFLTATQTTNVCKLKKK